MFLSFFYTLRYFHSRAITVNQASPTRLIVLRAPTAIALLSKVPWSARLALVDRTVKASGTKYRQVFARKVITANLERGLL